jgi:hypothetical protein
MSVAPWRVEISNTVMLKGILAIHLRVSNSMISTSVQFPIPNT